MGKLEMRETQVEVDTVEGGMMENALALGVLATEMLELVVVGENFVEHRQGNVTLVEVEPEFEYPRVLVDIAFDIVLWEVVTSMVVNFLLLNVSVKLGRG